MNYELFIAKKLIGGRKQNAGFGSAIVKIAVAGISMGLAVMILSVAIVTGFKNEITDKVIGFGGHLQIVNYDNNTSYETYPISSEQNWLDPLKQMKGIASVNRYIVKAGIIKTEECLNGVVFKGVDADYDWNFFEQYIEEGKIVEISDSAKTNGVLISRNMANSLNMGVGDSFSVYFIQNPPRMRKFTIEGIYNTQLQEFDDIFAFVDMRHLQKLNGWNDDQITGYEVNISNIDSLLSYDLKLTRLCGNTFSPDGSALKVQNIKEEYPAIFDWLSLLDMNVWIILGLMVIVAGFNMVSGLLVIILEKVNMIGILKSLGAKDVSVRKIFLYFASYLTLKGMLWGNVAGIILCLVQKYTGIISLDPESYYLSSVPINLDILHIVALNAGTLAITVIMMILPSLIISKITPADSIRFN